MVRAVAFAIVLAAVAGCNSLLGIEDLTLVDARPPDGQTVFEIQQGVAGYAGTSDTFITDAEPTTAHGDDADLRWTMTNNVHALLRFDDLFGSTGPLPAGAIIQAATLEVEVIEAGSPAGLLYESRVDWTEGTTYNTLGANPGVFPNEDRGVQVPGSIDGSTLGKIQINVTLSITNWAATPTTNKGWIFVPAADAMLVRIASSEDPEIARRPKLIVQIAP